MALSSLKIFTVITFQEKARKDGQGGFNQPSPPLEQFRPLTTTKSGAPTSSRHPPPLQFFIPRVSPPQDRKQYNIDLKHWNTPVKHPPLLSPVSEQVLTAVWPDLDITMFGLYLYEWDILNYHNVEWMNSTNSLGVLELHLALSFKFSTAYYCSGSSQLIARLRPWRLQAHFEVMQSSSRPQATATSYEGALALHPKLTLSTFSCYYIYMDAGTCYSVYMYWYPKE